MENRLGPHSTGDGTGDSTGDGTESPVGTSGPTVPKDQLVTQIFPQRRSVFPNVTDVHGRLLQDSVGLDVYWLAAWEDVAGPGGSLYVHEDEVMRLDCMGPTYGHMHLNINQTSRYPNGEVARLYFSESTYEEQIERAAYELTTNVAYALTVNDDPRVRATRIEKATLEQAAGWMADIMKRLLHSKGRATRTNP